MALRDLPRDPETGEVIPPSLSYMYGTAEDTYVPAEAYSYDPGVLGKNNLEGLTADAGAMAAQRQALAQLGEMTQGATAFDRSRRQQLLGSQRDMERGALGAIGQGLQEQGVGGVESEALLASMRGQQGADRRSQQDLEYEAALQQRAIAALGQQADAGNTLAGQSYDEGARIARSADEYAKYNAEVTTGLRRQAAELANQVSGVNATRRGETFGRQLGAAARRVGQETEASQESQAEVQRIKDTARQQRQAGFGVVGGGIGLLAGGPAGAAAGYQLGSGGGGLLMDTVEDDEDDD